MPSRVILLTAILAVCINAPAFSGEQPRSSSRYLFAQPNASAPAPIIRAGDDKISDEYIVVLRDDVLGDHVSEVATAIATQVNASLQKIWSYAIKGFFVKMTEQQAQAVATHPLVKYVEENARWYLSATQQTNINPNTCDPTMNPNCPTVIDDRLWHLDRVDQNYTSPTNSFSYCTDGTGVTVYVVDTGVNKAHNEFAPNGARVLPGFNASGDFMPADDPCIGFAIPPSGSYANLETNGYNQEVGANGHGTAVASALGGNRVGVAKNVSIVPVKTARCDSNSARAWLPNHLYRQNQSMFRTNGSYIQAYYRALNGGYSSASDPGGWPTNDLCDPCATFIDNQITWQVIPRTQWQNVQTTQMITDGLSWILSPSNPGPKSYAVVTMSTFRRAFDPGVTGPGSMEEAVRNLLANNITVIASANNQNGNACDTSPGRMSLNNPDPAVASDVITAGGTMVINRPWNIDISDVGGQQANGGTAGLESAYDQTKAVREGRWICGPGDSSNCSNYTALCQPPSWLGSPSTCTITPTNSNYAGFQAGSNGGPCVTLFTPAKNLFLASITGADGYRDARIAGANASGTSWSAPIAAGFAARILQSNPTYAPAQVRAAMLANSVSTLDSNTLNPFDYNGIQLSGTPNKMLRLSDVNITSSPASTPAAQSGPTPLTVGASGTSTVTYQWFETNSDFDFATYHNGAHSSMPIAGATSATFNAPQSGVPKAYWVRATNSCGSADSDIAVVVPRPSAPMGVSAVANGSTVTVTWSAAAGAEKYLIQRKVSGQPWTQAGEVGAGTLMFTETPAAPGGMVVYQVISEAGAAYLPAGNLATSSPSNNDFASLNTATYEPLGTYPNFMTIKAQHLIELRQAVNNLCDAIATPREYQDADLQLSALQSLTVYASDFTSLMTHINNVRTNVALAVGASGFAEAPAAGVIIKAQHVQDLRDALQ